MKTAIATVVLTLVAGNAFAVSRYNAMDMACVAVRASIEHEGAVIMRYPSRSGGQLFGRYVRDKLFCPASMQPKYQYIPTADIRDCPVLACEYFDRETVFFMLTR